MPSKTFFISEPVYAGPGSANKNIEKYSPPHNGAGAAWFFFVSSHINSSARFFFGLSCDFACLGDPSHQGTVREKDTARVFFPWEGRGKG